MTLEAVLLWPCCSTQWLRQKSTQESAVLSDEIHSSRAFGGTSEVLPFPLHLNTGGKGVQIRKLMMLAVAGALQALHVSPALHQPLRAGWSSHGLLIPFPVKMLIRDAGVPGQQSAALSRADPWP